MAANRNRGKLTGEPVTQQIPVPADGVRMETFIPWTLVRRGAKKQVITPLDAPEGFREQEVQGPMAQSTDPDSALLKALGLAHYWQRLLDDDKIPSAAIIAQVEGIDVTQVRRLLRLCLVAPAVIEGLQERDDLYLEAIMRARWPSGWSS